MVTRAVPGASFDVEDVLSKLTWSEKIDLLTGRDFWHTNPVHRLGVPAIRVSDGPNGVRGTTFVNGIPAACFPCGTSLAATWDTELIKSGGAMMGKEAIAKGASCILGPTSNMQRSPLGGRGFESYSEDPVLAGAMATAVVNGIQSTGVSATMKHFVCNDQEHERQIVNSIVTERALREIYLLPFQLTQRDAKPDAYMTSYGALNGTHCSEDVKVLKNILREEWGFDGIVMSDWHGTYSATESILAGLDLEMPGPTRVRGDAVTVALNSRKLQAWDVDARVRAMLKFIKKAMKLSIPEDAPEKSIDSPETSKALRTIGAAGQVLLKNDGGVLPFKKNKTTAVIGPNAKIAAYSGGGSASLLPYYVITPFDGIKEQVKDVQYALGATGYKYLPLLSNISKISSSGKEGLSIKAYDKPPSDSSRKLLAEVSSTKSDLFFEDYLRDQVPGHLFYMDIEGTVTPKESAEYEFGLAVAGTAKLYVNDELLVDNATKQKAGDTFFSSGTVEERGSIHLKGGKEHKIRVEYGSAPTNLLNKIGGSMLQRGGVRIGGIVKVDVKKEIEKAVKLAKEVDQVIIVAGLSAEWESEGFDRSDMEIPGHTNELIAAIAAANPNTAVVLQSGCPVEMPWAKLVPSIIQSWYGGNETGNAIADVLFGSVNPSGKLPLSFPIRVEDNPAFLNFRSDRGRALYGEDVFIGYRFYEKTRRDVLFPFGHGLSYTSFTISKLKVSDEGDTIKVSVQVENSGELDGAEVVQVYVSQRSPSVTRPKKELKGFTKVHLKAGELKTASVEISKKYAASWYDEKKDAWIVEKDEYAVLVGESSASTPLVGGFQVETTSWWKGL